MREGKILKGDGGMRKIVLMLLVALLVLTLAAPAWAKDVYSFNPPVRVVVAGREIKTDVPAYLKNARTMVPLRAVSEAFGFDVQYVASAVDPVRITPILPGVNDQIKGVASDFGYFSLRPGERSMRFHPRIFEKDGTVATGSFEAADTVAAGDVATEVRNGRCFVPLRMVAEAFGCRVSWDAVTRTAIIGPPDADKILSYHERLYKRVTQDLKPAGIWRKRDGDNVILYAVAVVSNPRDSYIPNVSNVEIDIYVDGRKVGRAVQEFVMDREYASSHGGAAAVTVPWPKGETHTVKFIIDPDGKHWDADRNNNTYEKTVTID